MKVVELSTTILTGALVAATVSSCSSGDHKQTRATLSASPGRYATVIGAGPEGSPESGSGWIEDPIDLAIAPEDGIFVLTKTNGRIYTIRHDGSHQQGFSLPSPGDAVSIDTRPDGSLLVAQLTDDAGKLALWRLQRGKTPEKTDEQSAPKNADNVHLVHEPDDNILLLKDGHLQQISAQGTHESMPNPKGLAADSNILAAAADGDSLLLLLPAEFAWVKDNRVIRRLPIAKMDAHDGATIAPDGSGGAFVARYGPAIDHYSSQGHDGTVLLGYGDITGCGKGSVSGPTGNASDQYFSKATSLLSSNGQLYFTDPECHRVLTIGMPAKEYSP
jgi:hypothetical protein